MSLIFKTFFALIFLASAVEEIQKSNEWNEYKQKFELSFEGAEDDERKEIFENNAKFIREFNEKGDKSFRLGINKFAHMRPHEFVKGMKMRDRPMAEGYVETIKPYLPVPKSKDWRTYGVVSHVKDQKMCGSCYAFSAIDAIESHRAIKTGVLNILSEQEILDCSQKYGNEGCSGGWPDSVFKFGMETDIVTENDYHYLAVDEKCQVKNMTHHGYRLLSYVDIPKADEKALVRAIGHIGPVSIGIDADHREFRFYESGIFHIKQCSTEELDHAVLAVGYQLSDDGMSYIIVKNSWGTGWGEQGYIRIKLGENMCGISTAASYPIPK